MAEKPFPNTEPEINLFIQNLAVKLPLHKAELGTSGADLDFVANAALNYPYLINMAQSVSDSKEAFTTFKRAVFEGDPSTPMPAVPTFNSVSMPGGPQSGIVAGIKAIVKRAKTSAGYTETIGDDLGFIEGDNNALDPTTLTAGLKIKALSGSVVQINFSKQGQDAMRVEFRRKGDTKWGLAGVYTSSPGIHAESPVTPDEPESRDYRGTLIKKNLAVGNYSPTYTVVTTP